MKLNVNLKSNKSVNFLAIALVCISLVTSFQNCGRAGGDGSSGSSSTLLSTGVDLKAIFGSDASRVEAAPFAFDVGFDQITYNSCASETAASNNNYFTIKAGAYGNAGIAINKTFYDYVKNNFKPIDDAPELSISQIKRFLAYSPLNYEAKLQMAVRQASEIRTGVPSQSGSPVAGTDYSDLLMDITDDRIMDALVKNIKQTPSNVTYFPLGPQTVSRTLEGTYTKNNNSASEDYLRSLFNGADTTSKVGLVYLTLTFKDNQPNAPLYAARYPKDKEKDHSVAYGRRYRLRFDSPKSRYSLVSGPGLYGGNPQNILADIVEENLDGSQIDNPGTWDCSRTYTVIRPEDSLKYPNLCPAESIDAINDVNYLSEINIARRHLPASAWKINTKLGCVVPNTSGSSCYPPSQTPEIDNLGIAYDQTAKCYFEFASGGQPTDGAYPRCANHITICVRK